jgi:2-octaprenyl-6-methoxyphenol hydroxylase
MRSYDVIIAGGGFVGRTFALGLARLAPDGFRVALVDTQAGGQGNEGADPRASALSDATKQLLTALVIWPQLASDAQAIESIEITDSGLEAQVRQQLLGFDLDPDEPRAVMVENQRLLRALGVAVAREAAIECIAPDSVADFSHGLASVTVTLGSGAEFSAQLLVAADGKRSRLREQAGIKCVGWSYPQTGIVTTVAHTKPHRGRAVQHFLPAGPFAILPLKGDRSSIVWSEQRERATAIMAGDDASFLAELSLRFGHQLGELSLAGPRQSFPLDLQIARSFVADRFVLIGDAAHAVHPLAGQGLNIGMRDVAALIEVLVDGARLGLDLGSAPLLERYERWRRFDSAFSAMAMDGLNRLFSNDNAPLRLLRDLGLGLVDHTPELKRFFVREAAGLTGDVPKLLKGQAL